MDLRSTDRLIGGKVAWMPPNLFLILRRKTAATRYMEVFSYRTISAPATGEYKEKGSKFLAFACPVDGEENVKERLTEIRKKFYDARHHCFAYTLGAAKSKFRTFDDGEPNHSAGDPILGQIRSKELTNVLVIVVRYFGGVRLGVGGLISAYKAAAEDALNKANIIEKEVVVYYTLHYPYSATPAIMKLIKDFDVEIRNQSFENTCMMEIAISLRLKVAFEEKIELLKALGTPISYN